MLEGASLKRNPKNEIIPKSNSTFFLINGQNIIQNYDFWQPQILQNSPFENQFKQF